MSKNCRIITAPVGSGKTEAALRVLLDTLAAKPFARVWVLLATRRQEDAFRQRLTEFNDGRSIYFNVEFFNFYELNGKLLKLAGQPARVLSDSAIYNLIRAITTGLRDEGLLNLYAPIAHMPGFVGIIVNLIGELKANLITPEQFMAAAQARQSVKDYELALIYARYQEKMRDFDLVDREGEGWLALARVQEQTTLAADVDLLIVDGYDQFSEVQLDMLTQLSSRVRQTIITLTVVPGREDTIGRRFETAYQQLRAKMPDVLIETLTGLDREHDIAHLIRTIFLPEAAASTLTESPTGEVKFIEAPDEAAEVAAVLRHVKRLLLNKQCAPDDILIALRDWSRYQPHFLTYQREYQIPLALHYGEPLRENPVIALILKLLTLSASDFRRRDLLDVLRSPYINVPAMDEAVIDLLERISFEFQVVKGMDQWFEAIERAVEPLASDFPEQGDEPEAGIITREQADALKWILSDFFAYLSPNDEAELTYYVSWLEDLIGLDPKDNAAYEDEDEPLLFPPSYSLDIIACVRQADDQLEARDLLALDTFKKLLGSMLTTGDLLIALGAVQSGERITWNTFFTDLVLALDSASITPTPNRNGQVLVTTAANARGLPHHHVFVPGLAEGVFPAPVSQDPLYLDSERLALRDAGVILKTQIERANDDGLFYELICLPRRSLVFSRPTTNNGEPWIESHLWSAAMRVFDTPQVERYRAGEVPPATQAASPGEMLLSVSDGLSHAAAAEETVAAYNWLVQNRRDYWIRIAANRHIENERFSAQVGFNRYSGRLENPALIEIVAGKFGDQRRWSATQLNDYGINPFRFFAQRLLKLERLQEPEEGMDVLQRGSVIHHILEMTYRRYQRARLAIHPDNRQQALDILEAEAQEALAEAPDAFKFRPSVTWESEKGFMLEQLRRFVNRDFSPESPVIEEFGDAERYPYLLEAAFGRDGRPDAFIEIGDLKLRINGYIDRIDKVGNQAVVIDYKSSSKQYRVDDMAKGLNYQMIVYLFAAQSILAADKSPDAPQSIAGGFFWSTVKGTHSGVLKLGEHHETIQDALNLLERYIPQMRAGYFPVSPTKRENGKCVSFCDYHQLCRLCGVRVFKPQ